MTIKQLRELNKTKGLIKYLTFKQRSNIIKKLDDVFNQIGKTFYKELRTKLMLTLNELASKNKGELK